MSWDDPVRYKVSSLNRRYLLKMVSGHCGFGRGEKKTESLKKKTVLNAEQD